MTQRHTHWHVRGEHSRDKAEILFQQTKKESNVKGKRNPKHLLYHITALFFPPLDCLRAAAVTKYALCALGHCTVSQCRALYFDPRATCKKKTCIALMCVLLVCDTQGLWVRITKRVCLHTTMRAAVRPGKLWLSLAHCVPHAGGVLPIAYLLQCSTRIARYKEVLSQKHALLFCTYQKGQLFLKSPLTYQSQHWLPLFRNIYNSTRIWPHSKHGRLFCRKDNNASHVKRTTTLMPDQNVPPLAS